MTSGRTRASKKKYFTIVSVFVIALLAAGAVLLQYSIDDAGATGVGWSESSPFDTARSFLDILGGARQSLAAYFWSKTDTLHHSYFDGDVTREQALFPYYWMITRLDPHFIMPYYYASYMLCRHGQTEEGLQLALEGLRQNPYSSTLQGNLASIYLLFDEEPEKARYHLLKAISLTDDEQEILVYESLLSVVDDVISGEREVPRAQTFEEDRRLIEFMKEQESEHEHQHGDHEHHHEEDHEHHDESREE